MTTKKLDKKQIEVIKSLIDADTFTLHDGCICVADIDLSIRKKTLFDIIEKLRLRGDVFKEYYIDPEDKYNIEISFTDFVISQIK